MGPSVISRQLIWFARVSCSKCLTDTEYRTTTEAGHNVITTAHHELFVLSQAKSAMACKRVSFYTVYLYVQRTTLVITRVSLSLGTNSPVTGQSTIAGTFCKRHKHVFALTLLTTVKYKYSSVQSTLKHLPHPVSLW